MPGAAAAPRVAGDGPLAEETLPAGRPEPTASTSSSEPTEGAGLRDRARSGDWKAGLADPARSRSDRRLALGARESASAEDMQAGTDVRGSRRTITARRADVEDQCQVKARPCALNRVTARPGGLRWATGRNTETTEMMPRVSMVEISV